MFVSLNFYGNHTIANDPEVLLTDSWVKNNKDFGITENKSTEASSCVRINRWPVEKIVKRGYSLVAIYYGDIDPDRNNFKDGIHPLFYNENQTSPTSTEWGSIGAWAWGLSKAIDYLEQDQSYSTNNYISFGHSRLGKASLWAGAIDPRIKLVISNNSGCGDAALSMRVYGEHINRINTNFPHWFNDEFLKYNHNEEGLAFDQHMLLSLIAPRYLYVASAEEDRWADPKGEFLSAYHASEVYQLYNKPALEGNSFPPVNQAIHTTIGYHIRTGVHDVTEYDWEQYMDFADERLK